MARLFSCGFELQSVTDLYEFQESWGAGQSIDTTTKRSGAASYKIISSDGESRYVENRYTSSDVVAYARFYVNFSSFPSDTHGAIFALLYSGPLGGENASIAITTEGKLRLYDGNIAGTQRGSDSDALSTGTWYRVELKVENGGSPEIEAKIDGSVFASGEMTMNADTDTVYFGMIDWVADCTAYFDDIAINSDSGSDQASYPGSGKIVHLRPNAAGDTNTADSGDYSDLDEIEPDGDTSFVDFVNANETIDVNLDSSTTAGIGSSDTITLAQVGYTAAGDSAGERSGKLRIKGQASGTVSETATLAVTSDSYESHRPSPFSYKLTAYVNPQDSAAWEPSDLDTAQIGFEAIDASPDVKLTTLWALVEYVEAEAPTGISANRLLRGQGI
jgi:hypothetical protein